MSDPDITLIPAIMDSNNWPTGAALMRRWFSAAANTVPVAATPSLTDVSMSWILTYPRAKLIYDQLIAEKIWVNDAGKKEIIRMLKKKGLVNILGGSFGTPKIGLPHVDKDYIQFRKVGSTMDIVFGPIDDLKAALANFVFRVVIIGKVEPLLRDKKPTGEYKVTLSEVGIYAKDSYDFNDTPHNDQSLGNWDFDDNSVGRTMFNGGTSVNNSDFRKWRTANQKGGDFLVYSNILYTVVNDTFTFKK